MLHQMKPFSDEGSSPSPLERGWGEVKQTRQGFQSFCRTTITNYKEKINKNCSHIACANKQFCLIASEQLFLQ